MIPLLRRRYFVRRFQTRLVLFQAFYFAALILALYACLVLPLLSAAQDSGRPLGDRAGSAEALILFDRRVLPVLLPLILVLFAHSVRTSHRIAGPLYRFSAILRSVATGDLSMGVRTRKHDYLDEERDLLDAALTSLRQRLLDLRADARLLDQTLAQIEGGSAEDAAESLRAARRASARVSAKLESFTLEAPDPPALTSRENAATNGLALPREAA